ncbi:MAG: threonine--tRNA ligase [Clostridiales bacterium]|nr:threonine--tRNA ligase [Clostridiales bacterium]
MIHVTLKDGSVKEFENGISVMEIVKGLGAGLYKVACVCKVNGELCDLRTVLNEDCALEVLTFDSEEGRRAFNHTASHILAQAVKRLYPGAKLAIGPAIADGFYYDIDVEPAFGPEELEKIEAEMHKIVKEAYDIERFELDRAGADALMADEPYKLELIAEHSANGEPVSFYKQGEFTDLCAGPHLPDTGRVKAVKLIQTTGAYWRGDAQNKMLCRVYGVAFPKQSELDAHLKMLEEAKKRDHRKLGKELELFDIFDEGPGFPAFLPNGMVVRNELEKFWREIHQKAGYVEVRTPQIMSRTLWENSGHWDHYKDNMYTTIIDDMDYCIKPMNCPGGILVYKRKPHSYRDLPIRMGELGIVHRHELSGALHGLMRVRCFTQDDAHIFCTPDQLMDEIFGVINLIDSVYKVFGFEYDLELSTRPEDSMGSDEDWEAATNALRQALDSLDRPYKINEGDGAFYGPKIDFHLHDCIGRTWQCGTIQVDFQMPERFDITYMGADGEKHRPIMLHRVAFGSIERFIGILIEQFAGAFPLWLAPVQVEVIPVSERHLGYAAKVRDQMRAAGLRCELDTRNEKMGYKIREAQMMKIPYMLVVGDKEIENNTVAVRSRAGGDLGVMEPDAFLAKAKEEIDTKALESVF